ncbi:MmcQ/YjbR family DNA-binding protein [Rhizohabitans arisaemae]|uniref:MmcQ/YjbR family DNA-binding protein n=1 Tax=Rhizohabitans arisaemae TaxID=2720610 RepID=UPI0024B13327|nr:MmcQ/YjbR family DNA-binding protein [Rhizohabitans arisaemae]
MSLPEVTESTSWGTPSFKVRGKFFLRWHEDPELVVFKVELEERAALVGERPETFLVTGHYERYQLMLVRTADLPDDELRELVVEAWRMAAPKRLLASFDG